MTEEELDDLLSTPRNDTVIALEVCPGDIVILGAGGKMGPTRPTHHCRLALVVRRSRALVE